MSDEDDSMQEDEYTSDDYTNDYFDGDEEAYDDYVESLEDWGKDD